MAGVGVSVLTTTGVVVGRTAFVGVDAGMVDVDATVAAGTVTVKVVGAGREIAARVGVAVDVGTAVGSAVGVANRRGRRRFYIAVAATQTKWSARLRALAAVRVPHPNRHCVPHVQRAGGPNVLPPHHRISNLA